MSCPHCGAENELAAFACAACGASLGGLREGQVLAGRFEVKARLGSGGMGVVYKAHDRELDEVVALKVLRGELARSEEMARRFRSEIKLARRVRNAHVCGIHEYGQDGPLRFIVMEFVQGVDLKRVLSAGAPPVEDAFAIGRQLAAALGAIHEAGIVHRDLKPANVMLDGERRVRLMDFGIAKQSGQAAGAGLTAAGHVVGTPEYMSPEQIRGGELDARSDIYSLGVVLFELFAGQVPFRGPTAVATLYQHVHDPVPLEAARAAGAPPPVLPVLERALAKDPAARYATAAEVASALGEAQAGAAGDRSARDAATPTTTLVRAQLALQPEPVTAGEVALQKTLPAGAATAVQAPAAPPRRPYQGPRPQVAHPRPAPSRGPLAAVVVLGLAAAGAAVAFFQGPRLREVLGLVGASAPAVTLPPAAPSVAVEPASAPAVVPGGAAPTFEPPAQVVTASPRAEPTATSAPAPAPSVAASTAAPPLPTPAAPRPEAPRPAASMDRAEQLFADGRFASALAEARAVLEADPSNSEAQQLAEDAQVELLVDQRLKEARAALAAGDRDRALAALRRGLDAKPTDSRLVALRKQVTGE